MAPSFSASFGSHCITCFDIPSSLILSGLFIETFLHSYDRLCGLVVSVLGYRSGDPGSIPGTTRKKVVGLERGALSLVELLDRKVASPV
jgi:hypothetical protein